MGLAEWAPAIVTAVGGISSIIFISGQITGRIKNQENVIASHDIRLGLHDVTLGEHSVAIAENKAWQRGYDAARGHKA